MEDPFVAAIQSHYAQAPGTICLGGIYHESAIVKECMLAASLQSLNRHGLIAGATGTGKTKTIQMLAEQLSTHGISTLLMDIKGDLSGLAMPGEKNAQISDRQQSLNLPYHPQAFPVTLLAMGAQPGVKVRTTLVEFGALLFSKMLELNETQTSIMSILFQYAKDNQLLLQDLADIKALIQYAQSEGKANIEKTYGSIATVSLKSILRNIIELEAQGGHELFGSPSFDVGDLLQNNAAGYGVISILRLLNLQDKPKLFSTFMLGLLSSVYSKFPEVGDIAQPKLVIFIDEAHLIFSQASKALLTQLETIVKLIRSKGVGLIFCTQSPDDIPDTVLSQLGLKIQHALRAFTAKDRKAIKLAAENFPLTPFYDTVSLLTSLGIGQALVSALDNHGKPTPLVQAVMRAPESRMGPLSDEEITTLVNQSELVKKYDCRLEHASSATLLLKKHQETDSTPQDTKKTTPANQPSSIETLSKNTLFRQIVRAIVQEITKAVIAALGIKRRK